MTGDKDNVDMRDETQARIIRLEESQEHFGKQLDQLSLTVTHQFGNIEKSIGALVNDFSNKGKISWPIIVSGIMLTLSLITFGATGVAGYVQLQTTPLKVQASYIEGMREEIKEIKVVQATALVRLRNDENVINHLWKKVGHPETPSDIIPTKY